MTSLISTWKKNVLRNSKIVRVSLVYLAKYQPYEIHVLTSKGKLHGGMEIEYLIKIIGNNDMSNNYHLGTCWCHRHCIRYFLTFSDSLQTTTEVVSATFTVISEVIPLIRKLRLRKEKTPGKKCIASERMRLNSNHTSVS